MRSMMERVVSRIELHPEVFLAAFATYGVIVLGTLL
jgi:hypothetical protein